MSFLGPPNFGRIAVAGDDTILSTYWGDVLEIEAGSGVTITTDPVTRKVTISASGGPGSEAFPVGSIFTSVVATNPNTLLGYGTWAAIAAGKVLVGLDSGDADFDTVEEIGGAKTVTLTEAQIPAHTHLQNSHNHTQDAHNHTQDSHTHTQDAHTHIQDAHTHIQNAHNHTQAATTTSTGSTSNRLGTVDTSSTAVNTGNATAVNQDTTAVNQNATAVNQGTVAVNQAATAVNQAITAVNQSTGGGGSHSNLQPYFVVYMWKRTV